MSVTPIDPLCERTCAWTSLELDGELPELEGLLLNEHLRGCADCAALADDLRRVATLLRGAPLAEPARRFEVPDHLPVRRRARPVAARALVAVAVVALAAGLGVLGSSLGGSTSAPQTVSPEIAFLPLSVDRQIRGLRQLPKPKQRVAPDGRLAAVV